MISTRRCTALLAASLLVGGCTATDGSDDPSPDDPAPDESAADPDGAAEGGELTDPPQVDGQPLSAEAVTEALVALLEADLADGEVCEALGLDEAELRELSRSDEGPDELADQAPMYDDVFDGFIGCTAPTAVVADEEGTPTAMPGIGVDLYRFDATPDDVAVDGEVTTTPDGRTARLSGFVYDPETPEAGSAVTWTIYSLERSAAVRVSGHTRAQGSTPEGLGGLLDEVLDRFA